jgi:hypothetical protein
VCVSVYYMFSILVFPTTTTKLDAGLLAIILGFPVSLSKC